MTTQASDAAVARLLPKYLSHKEVWALKIARIEQLLDAAGVRLFFQDESYAPIDLDHAYQRRVKRGDDPGYYVRYADGYESWSPTDAFETGYTLVK